MSNEEKEGLGMPCQICGKPATRFQFGAPICDSLECENEAFERRGGPAGHQLPGGMSRLVKDR